MEKVKLQIGTYRLRDEHGNFSNPQPIYKTVESKILKNGEYAIVEKSRELHATFLFDCYNDYLAKHKLRRSVAGRIQGNELNRTNVANQRDN